MTIKITQVATASGQIMLTATYDNPKGTGTLYTFQLSYQSLVDRLVQVASLLGRNVTLTDAQQARAHGTSTGQT